MPNMATSASTPSSTSSALIAGAAAAAAIAAMGLYRARSSLKRGDNSGGDETNRGNQCVGEGSVTITLPEWAVSFSKKYFDKTFKTDEEMMALAVHLSDRNVAEGTGGPFGCAIFERVGPDSEARLFSIGVNRVVALNNSTLHGETVAIQMAQRKVNSYTLNLPAADNESELDDEKKSETSPPMRQFELFTSCEPCVMCLGATLWSGVARIVCGARKADAAAIGFDEGPVFEASYEHLEQAGIEVKRGVLQKEAADVLRRYGETGVIYNR